MAKDSRRGARRRAHLASVLLLSAVATAGMVRPAIAVAAGTDPGVEIYARKCAACHGAGMAGGEGAPALTGQRFVRKWAGKPLLQLSEKIRVTMPQDDPGTLRADETAALLAAILTANGIEPVDGRLALSPVDREQADPPHKLSAPGVSSHSCCGKPSAIS